MATDAFARSKTYRSWLGWGLLSGLIGAVGAFVFIVIMNLGLGWLWPQPPGPEPFSGSWRIVVIMTMAGLIVGLIRRFMLVKDIDVFESIIKGRLDPRPVPGALLVAMVSLVGGFSLGPEVPTGMLAGAAGTWLSDRRRLSGESRKINVLSGVMGAYGGLFTSPFTVIMMPLEMRHSQSRAYYGKLIIAALAGVVGFILFFSKAGNQFADLLRILDLPEYNLQIWHLGMAVIFAVLGTVLAVIFGLLLRLFKGLVAPLERQPELCSTLAGLLLGLLGMALPLTLFLGSDGLETVINQGAQLGIALLTIVLLVKMVALAGALAGGFIGGPIFPLLFVGCTAGVVINLIFPAIPLALCVGCMMAAVPGALLPIPLSLSVIVLLITGLPPTEAVPIPLTALVAYFIVNGILGLGNQETGPEASQ